MPESACNFIKKETLAQVFSCEFREFLRKPFFTEHLWWLLLTLSNCFRPTNINETCRIEATSNTSTSNNGNLDSKLNDVNNSILQLKDLIDQAQKFLHNLQDTVNVALNPEQTVFNLGVANYLKNQDNS